MDLFISRLPNAALNPPKGRALAFGKVRETLTACALLALAACATALPQVVPGEGDLFAVRYDQAAQTPAEADAVANAYCANGAAGYVSEETRFDGFAYRTYRCAFR